jgi:hypothetical protein
MAVLHLIDGVATISGVEVLRTADNDAPGGGQGCFKRCFVLLLVGIVLFQILVMTSGDLLHIFILFFATMFLLCSIFVSPAMFPMRSFFFATRAQHFCYNVSSEVPASRAFSFDF